jgi:hypothetical protein
MKSQIFGIWSFSANIHSRTSVDKVENFFIKKRRLLDNNCSESADISPGFNARVKKAFLIALMFYAPCHKTHKKELHQPQAAFRDEITPKQESYLWFDVCNVTFCVEKGECLFAARTASSGGARLFSTRGQQFPTEELR